MKIKFSIITFKILIVVGFLVIGSCGNDSNERHVETMPEIPTTGSYIGGILLDGQMTIAEFNDALGVQHAIFMQYINFPEVLTEYADKIKLSIFVDACKEANAIPMITLESFGGLDSYTSEDVEAFAAVLYDFKTSIFLRFNHEMNGSWYVWGQQPTLFIKKFIEFAGIIHASAPNVAMVWTPNQGWGYPWAGGEYSVTPISSDYSVLDTNDDGIVSDQDDPYSPYYPGNDYVDWVGFSFYHWGNGADRGVNQMPYNEKWAQINGIGNNVPNFHDVYAVANDKPMVIAETSALYNPVVGGATNAEIKNQWVAEVYNLTNNDYMKIDESLPKVKAILWFNQYKLENEVGANIDWMLTSDQNVIDFYRQTVSDDYFIKMGTSSMNSLF